MTYPDCYEPAEHRRALGKVLADLEAVIETETKTNQENDEQQMSESVDTPQQDPVIQVRSIVPDENHLVHEPVN